MPINDPKCELVRDVDQFHDVAVVAIACKLPKADTPEDAWKIIASGSHAITEASPDRWMTRKPVADGAGRQARGFPKWGGYVDGIDMFDPAFFRVSKREARFMDPQQRLLLQTSWRALENTGHDPRTLSGTRTGVFVGISTSDYLQRQLLDNDVLKIDAYGALGSAQSIAANRISHFFDFNGPSLAVDTACSSGLVALHLARKSLRDGECDLAIVAGVNAILSPLSSLAFSKMRMLSADGHCKSFSRSADGYVRSEGCVVIVLQRLTDAIRNESRIHAVVKGSAVNQDGKTPSLSTPSAQSQQAAVTEALADAGLASSDLDFIEAHGTGTQTGDSIELHALSAALRGTVSDAPVIIGSAKPHFGHLEAASGLVGVLKAIKSLEHRHMPALPGLIDPIAELPGIRLALEATDFARTERPLRAGVSSFGFGGTNAHIVLEEPNPTQLDRRSEPSADWPKIMPLSSHTQSTLGKTAASYAAMLRSDPKMDPDALGVNVSIRRSLQPCRTAVTHSSRDELLQKLDDIAIARPVADAVPKTRKIAFCFSGVGTQFAGMCKSIYQSNKVFRAVIDRCNSTIVKEAGWSLTDILLHDDGAQIDDTKFAQPALFAVELALARVWIAHGVFPDVVMGQSLGEIIAACVAGVMTEDTAIQLVLAQGRLMATAPGQGAMVSLSGAPDLLRKFIGGATGGGELAEIASKNSSRSINLAGRADQIAQIKEDAIAQGLKAEILQVSHAFHTRMMNPILDTFRSEIAKLSFSAPTIPMVSCVTGSLFPDGVVPDCDYWTRHIREAVDFHSGVKAVIALGANMAIEMSPRPQLAVWLYQIGASADLVVIPALRKGQDTPKGLQVGLAKAWSNNASVDWSAQYKGHRASLPILPPYEFDESRYWFDVSTSSPDIAVLPTAIPKRDVGANLARSGDTLALLVQSFSDQTLVDLLAQHRVGGKAVVPAAFLVDLLLAGVRKLSGASRLMLEDIRVSARLSLNEACHGHLEVRAVPNGKNSWAIAIVAVTTSEVAPKVLAEGRAALAPDALPPLLRHRKPHDQSLTRRELYPLLGDSGLSYGPQFQGVTSVDFAPGQATANIDLSGTKPWPSHVLDPRILDSALHAIGPALWYADGPTSEGLWMPIAFGCLQVHASVGQEAEVQLALVPGPQLPDLMAFDVTVKTASGETALVLQRLTVRKVAQRKGAPSATGPFFSLQSKVIPLSTITAADWRAGWQLVPFGYTSELVTEMAALLQEPTIALDTEIRGGKGVVAVLIDDHALDGLGPYLLGRLSEVARKLMEFQDGDRPQFLLVVRTQNSDQPSPEIEALRAGMRVLSNEALSLGCVALVLPETPLQLAALASAYFNVGEPDQTWADGGIRVPRIVPLSPPSEWSPAPLRADSHELVVGGRDGISSLILKVCDAPDPGIGEVTILTEAAGLNFRDVLKTLRLYPRLPDTPFWLGDECVGRIIALGEGVTNLNIGDKVLAVAPHSFARKVLASEAAVMRLPDGMSATDAATIPIAFTTAWHALVDIGRIAPGERVLIHAAAGAVGLAALQIAQLHGAQVFATAGSEEKRMFLQQLGVSAVGNSRDLSFVDTVHVATDGEGVDIVLNSLTGDAITESVKLLRAHGRFVEIGKRDIFNNSPLPMASFHNAISFTAVDMEMFFNKSPKEGRRLMETVLAAFKTGDLHPLPCVSYDTSLAVEAFQDLAKAKNIGKVVLTFEQHTEQHTDQRPSAVVRDEKMQAALITGAFGGIGLYAVKQLVADGIRGFLLLGRTQPSAEARKVLAQLREDGVLIVTATADVSDMESISQVVHETAPAAGLDIRHIVHAAGILADGESVDLTIEDFSRAWDPKVIGADVLDRVSRSLPIQTFVCLSSFGVLLGSPGQMAYAAANAAMEAVCARRAAAGFPALAIASGPWSIGMTTKNNATLGRMERFGLRPFSAISGMRTLSQAMACTARHIVAVRLAEPEKGEVVPAIARQAICRGLYGESFSDAASVSDAMTELLSERPEDRAVYLMRYLAGRLALVIGNETAPVATDLPLDTLGFDSITGLEFGMSVEDDFGLSLPMDALNGKTTLQDLAAVLLESMPDLDRSEII
jgi:phthiocerol/phenolphthiocerol synthesis type-I polyketide synthase C